MNKILLVAPYDGVQGGISRWTSHIITHQKNCEECAYDLVLLPIGRKKFINNMPVWHRIWYALIDYSKIIKKYNSEIKKNYEIVHITTSASFSLFKDIYMLKNARNKGIKSVIHFHFGRIPELAEKNNWEWKLVKKVIRLADKAIVIDQLSYDTLSEYGFKNIEYLPNPVAPIVEKYVAENHDIVRINGQLLFAGHVVKTKGIWELLKACSTLANIHLNVIGRTTPEILQEIEKRYGRPKWLTILGERPFEDVIKQMMSCDIFVLPTYTEGFPNVILEAMASSCAIISTPVGAIPQMLENDKNGRYGMLVAPKDSKTLARTLQSLLDNEQLKNEMRKNVCKRVSERYNINSVWQKLVSIWETC